MARRKIGDPEKIDFSDIDATDKQIQFAFDYVMGKGVAASYRLHYDCSNMRANSVAVEASRLLAHPKVSLIVSLLRQAHFGEAVLSKEEHLRELARLREVALATNNVGAAVQAEQLRGKAAGHYIEQIEYKNNNNPADLLEEIAREFAAMSPEAIAEIKRKTDFNSETKH